MRSSNAIEELVAACVDDERMLRYESRAVDGAGHDLLDRLASERSECVTRLSLAEGRLGPRTRMGSPGQRFREIGRWLRTLLGGPHQGDSIAACRRSCRRTEELFDKAMDLQLVDKVRAAVVAERAVVEEAHDALIAAQYGGSAREVEALAAR